jgi:hypothetical protein
MSFARMPCPAPMDKKKRADLDMMKGMINLSSSDAGMKELIEKAQVYYILKGSPPALSWWDGTDFPGQY